MYKIKHYVDVNDIGTALLLELLTTTKNKIKKLVVASSMSIYGEGAYDCKKCGRIFPQLRSPEQLSKRIWEVYCPNCKSQVTPLNTDEEKPLKPTSVYAITKRNQEELCLSVGWAYKIPTVALRYFNIYGPRQALSNPYTGVAAIFASRLLNGKDPLIFEDGLQRRDFVHVKDIVQANILAIEKKEADYGYFNVGTGESVSVLDIANILIEKLKSSNRPMIVNKFRSGDIRHCYADITKIKNALGFMAKVKFRDGICELGDWLKTQKAEDLVEIATEELERRGLTL
jgi:dTDP-L-rhamnose 4-epimerase